MRLNTQAGGPWLVLIAATLWGTVGPTTQLLYSLTPTTPLSINFFRMVISTPFLALACWRLLGRRMLQIAPRDLAVMLFLGVLVALDQAAYFFAIAYAGAAIATLVTICSAPVVVAFLSALILREKLSSRALLALGVALTGTVLLVGVGGAMEGRSNLLLGVGCAFISAVLYAGVLLVGRFLSGRCHPLQVTTVGFTAGSVLLLILASATGFVTTYPASGWLLLVYLGVVPTAIAYGLFLTGMRSTAAPAASILVLLEPLTATVLAWIAFGDAFGLLQLLGALMLCGAIVLLSSGGTERQERQGRQVRQEN